MPRSPRSASHHRRGRPSGTWRPLVCHDPWLGRVLPPEEAHGGRGVSLRSVDARCGDSPHGCTRDGYLDAGRRRPQHRAVLAGDVRRGMARRRDGPVAWCSVPRPCQAQRDRSGLLDDLPGDGVRSGSGVRFRRADRRPRRQHLALQFTPNGNGTDVTESFKVPMPEFLRATSFLGFLRKRRNLRDMRTTLERIKAVVEA